MALIQHFDFDFFFIGKGIACNWTHLLLEKIISFGDVVLKVQGWGEWSSTFSRSGEN